MDEEAEPGWLGRIGQTMIAHPFLTLLLLLASLFIAMSVMRRPASQQTPTQAAAPDAPPSAPADARMPPDNRPAFRENATEGERPRGPLPEAVSACSGKPPGAGCSFIDRRNQNLNGRCAGLPDGAVICRPERNRPQESGQPGAPRSPDAFRNPADTRPPR